MMGRVNHERLRILRLCEPNNGDVTVEVDTGKEVYEAVIAHAVQLPPHGRLIDADALQLKLLTAEPGKVYDFCYPCKEVLQAIKDSPTIIERETN